MRQAAGEATARRDESTIQANKLLDPYRETGDQSTNLLTQGLAAGGDFNRTPTQADIQIDPGFEFRRAQAQKALEGSAAARGGALGGGALGQIAGLNSNLASQEYQNAFQRFRDTTSDRFNRLNLTAARGADVAGTQGSNLTKGAEFGSNLNYNSAFDAGNINFKAAQQAGINSIQGVNDVNNLLVGGAQAQGAGIVGKTQSIVGGLQGAADVGLGVATTRNLLKNPYPGGYNPIYAGNPLGGGKYGAGPQLPPGDPRRGVIYD